MKPIASEPVAAKVSRAAAAMVPISLISPIGLWAFAGGSFACFSCWVFAHWLLSPQAFAAVPLTPADAMQPLTLLLLRLVEVISTAVALAAFYFYLLRPWLRSGTPPLAGLLLVGALISYVLDTTVNYHDYHMAWNRHSFNFGTWAAGFPGHTGPTRYAEAWLWGPPMYVYFGVGLGGILLKAFDVLRPRVGLLPALACAFVLAFVFDLVAESTIIQASEAYAWPYTVRALSLWPGTQFQFPLYESLLVAIYATLYALLLKSARDKRLSFIERGLERLPAMARLPARLLAATGFAAACTAMYFGGFYAVSQYADSRVAMPSYLMYADPAWAPSR